MPAALAGPALAQPATPEGAAQPAEADAGPSGRDAEVQALVVTGAPPGQVVGDVQPERQLGPAEIRALGVSSVAELLQVIELQTVGAGRRGGRTVTLVNGAPISDFSEIQELPPEAILRLDILPAEVALRYGFKADQLVLNFVLQPHIGAAVAEANARTTTEGGGEGYGAAINLLRVEGENRLQFDVRAALTRPLLESQRLGGGRVDPLGNVIALAGREGGEIDPALSALAGRIVTETGVPDTALAGSPTLQDFAAAPPGASDDSAYRTLLPDTEQVSIGGVVARALPHAITVTLNARLERGRSETQLGLADTSVVIPADNPFSPFTRTVELERFDVGAGALRQTIEQTRAHVGAAAEGAISGWRWSVLANADRKLTHSLTQTGDDIGVLQAAILEGRTDVNPFASPTAGVSVREPDRARSLATSSDIQLLVNGSPLALPAGEAILALKLGAEARRIEGRSEIADEVRSTALSRNIGSFQASLALPVARRRKGAPPGLGDVSLDAAYAVDDLSDFGALTTVVANASWSPLRPVRFTASLNSEDGAPSVENLGNPVVATGGVRVFDDVRGETAEVTRIEGGNPLLQAEHRRLLALSVTLRPWSRADFSLRADYIAARTRNVIAFATTATSELEAAFPDRFLRDSDGRLIQVDTRPFNLARRDTAELRWGLSYRGTVGGGRSVQLATLHTLRLQEDIFVQEGGPALDVLAGQGFGASRPRHEVEVLAAAAGDGYGVRLSGHWQAGSEVHGAHELIASPLATMSLNLFADLGRRSGAAGQPVQGRARLSLSVDNLFDARPKVRTPAGDTPFSYQPAFLDPAGRTVRLSLRKAYF